MPAPGGLPPEQVAGSSAAGAEGPGGGACRLGAERLGAWICLAKWNYPITFASPPMYRLAVSLDLWGLQRGDKPVRAAR
jgi:hypothetical protein